MKQLEYTQLLSISYDKLYSYIEELFSEYQKEKQTYRAEEFQGLSDYVKKAVRVRATQFHLENDYQDKRQDVKEKVYREYPLIAAFKEITGLELRYQDLVAIDYILTIKK